MNLCLRDVRENEVFTDNNEYSRLMRSAYLYQLINVGITLLMIPMLLRYLDVNGYVVWSLFATFGGITLQMENAIQNVSAREIAKRFHLQSRDMMPNVVAKLRKVYLILSAIVLGPLLVVGLLYMNFVAHKSIAGNWSFEWIVFAAAYAINYYFGVNNSILLGMNRIGVYSNINSITRSLNFVLTFGFLKLGLSVMGICMSFMSSVMVGCALIYRAAKMTLAEFGVSYADKANVIDHDDDIHRTKKIGYYTIYTFAAFVFYKGMLLVAAAIFPNTIVSGYGLTLQAYTLLTTLALVPTQVWLGRLVAAITSGKKNDIVKELAITIWVVNIIFIMGIGGLVIFGEMLLILIGSKVSLLEPLNVIIIGVAFLVEINIFVLANFLIIKNSYGFVRIYVAVGAGGSAVGILVALVMWESVTPLIVAPLVVQAVLSLPIVFKSVCQSIQYSRRQLLGDIFLRAWRRAR